MSYRQKLSPKHRAFVNKYVCTKYNPHRLYCRVFFCKDEDIAIVKRTEDANNMEAWGCVNMAHELLMPFEYERIWNYGRFLLGRGYRRRKGYRYLCLVLYNKKGQLLYEINEIKKTKHKAYKKLYELNSGFFRLSIRKMAISNFAYQRLHIMENGLVFLQNTEDKVGAILFSKLKLPFEYYALSRPQNGYMLAIKESTTSENENAVYDCLLIKVKSQIKKEDSIHPTGITLFTKKSEEDMFAFFSLENLSIREEEYSSLICYNEKVHISFAELEFFPFNYNITPSLHDWDEDEIEEGDEDEENEASEGNDYNPWARENYSYKDALDDAFGGEWDAYWNID